MKQSDRDPVCRPWALSLSATDNPAEYSRPLYESGEHARTGWDLYTDQLKVGQAPGVMFSYGELIAMGDLYRDASQMMEAPVAELRSVKNLLNFDRRYYAGGRADISLKVIDDNWVNVIGPRFLDLAEDNYAHFSPNYLFPNEPWAAHVASFSRDNKTYWRLNHTRAIVAAQQILQSQGNGSTPFLEKPLIMNAFGDHFLTDAFSAGHTISKDATIEMFKESFYDGKNLKPAAKKFFERVAEKAFVGKIKNKFSALETFDPIILWWHPNINSASRFCDLLTGIAEKKPDQIANLAVLSLHDDLNKRGVEVTNDFAAKPWRLTGDGLLNDENLEIIKRAVQQSVDDVNDPANATNPNISAKVDRVWQHVPRLTDASKALVIHLSREYTNPNSDLLVNAAAEKINQRVEILIKKLLDAKQLREDK